MQLYLIRHTEIKQSKDICYGRCDMPLTKDFHSQSEQVFQQLPAAIDQVYSSPSQRCLSLANKIITLQDSYDKANVNKHINKTRLTVEDVVQDERLLEFNYGDFEGQSWQSLAQQDLFRQWTENWQTQTTPNGESFTQFLQRVDSFITMLRHNAKSNNHNKNIAIITHHGVIRAFLLSTLQFPLDSFFKHKVDFGAVIKITLGEKALFDRIYL